MLSLVDCQSKTAEREYGENCVPFLKNMKPQEKCERTKWKSKETIFLKKNDSCAPSDSSKKYHEALTIRPLLAIAPPSIG